MVHAFLKYNQIGRDTWEEEERSREDVCVHVENHQGKGQRRINESSDHFLFSNKMVKAYRKYFTNTISKKVAFKE